MDPFVVDWDHVDALDVAFHEVEREVHLDEDDIVVGVGALQDDVQEYVVEVVVDRAWDDHALADDHTLDVADDGAVVAVTTHLFRLDDAYDAVQVVTMVVVVLNLDHDDSPVLASFHLVDQHHCFHYSVET